MALLIGICLAVLIVWYAFEHKVLPSDYDSHYVIIIMLMLMCFFGGLIISLVDRPEPAWKLECIKKGNTIVEKQAVEGYRTTYETCGRMK